MRKKKVLSILLSLLLITEVLPCNVGEVFAKEGEAENMNSENYGSLVWEENFDSKELNRDDWNVELHEVGWVNEELQEYVDSSKGFIHTKSNPTSGKAKAELNA